MIKGLVFEWKTKFGEYRLFCGDDKPETFALDKYAVKKKGPNDKGWKVLDLTSGLSAIDAEAVLYGIAAAKAS